MRVTHRRSERSPARAGGDGAVQRPGGPGGYRPCGSMRARSFGRDPETVVDRAERLGEEPFSSETKYHDHRQPAGWADASTISRARRRSCWGCATADATERTRILAQVEQWAGEGLRPLGLAYRPPAARWRSTAAIPGWGWWPWKTRSARACASRSPWPSARASRSR